jgi:hypothetical protein
MTTVSGDPEGMATYVERSAAAREEVAHRLTGVLAALDSLAGALVGVAAPTIPDVAAVLERVRTTDDFVGAVGRRFAEAGTPGEAGHLTLDDAVLQDLGYTALHGRSQHP